MNIYNPLFANTVHPLSLPPLLPPPTNTVDAILIQFHQVRTVALEAAVRVEQTEVGAAAAAPAARVAGRRLARAVHDVDVERLGGALLHRLDGAAVPLVGPAEVGGRRTVMEV